MPRVLFLCTGNYYRSRYAEIVFNHLAQARGLDWRAESRGLLADRPNGNIGPISPHALIGLARRGIAVPNTAPAPRQVASADLETAERVIALKEAEHRPLLAARFPGWEERVAYWQVHDLDQATARVALQQIDALVADLLAACAAEPPR